MSKRQEDFQQVPDNQDQGNLDMKFLTLLFNAACSESSIPHREHRIGSLYKRTSEAEASWDALNARMNALGFEDGVDRISPELNAFQEANECQGFINGFRMGMMLANELAAGKAVET